MNLYLISQNTNNDYDTYDSAVVCAASEAEARNMTLPYGKRRDWEKNDCSWVNWPDQVIVELIGTADPSRKEAGVVCASFNAG